MIADNSVPETVADTNPEDSNLPVAAASASKGVRTVTHKVKPGESLASIAKTYNVAPEQIKSWNSLRRNAVRTGQLLRINTASGEGESELLTAEATEVPAGGERTWQSDQNCLRSSDVLPVARFPDAHILSRREPLSHLRSSDMHEPAGRGEQEYMTVQENREQYRHGTED